MNRSDVLNSFGIALCVSFVLVGLVSFLLDGMASPRLVLILVPLCFAITLTGMTLRRRRRRR